jgi:hypothetical protein
MRWLVVLAGLAGCEFTGLGVADARRVMPVPDAAVDASTTEDADDDGIVDADDNCPAVPNVDQRDWDSDDHGDVCDRCPHLGSVADPDADNDGVGDDCDPRPGTTDVREIWLGFYEPADITGWVNTGGNGQWTVGGGVLDQAASGFSLLDSPASYTDAYFATSLEVVAVDTSEIGFCLADVQPGIQYYCCGAANVGGVPSARAASAWATSGGQISVPGTFTGANLAVGEHVEMVGLLQGASFACSITQGAITATAGTPTGTKLGPAVFYTTAPVRYRYAFVVGLP